MLFTPIPKSLSPFGKGTLIQRVLFQVSPAGGDLEGV